MGSTAAQVCRQTGRQVHTDTDRHRERERESFTDTDTDTQTHNTTTKTTSHRCTDLCLELLVDGVVDPEVNVPAPVFLLCERGHIGNGALVHVPRLVDILAALRQPDVVKPRVVVVRVLLHLLLVLKLPLVEDDRVNALPVAVLLLKGRVRVKQLLRVLLRHPFKPVLVNQSRAFILCGGGKREREIDVCVRACACVRT